MAVMSSPNPSVIEAIRVRIEGAVTSFRYPHFLIGRQPSFPMPPPSTVYGLISSALGKLPSPDTLQFAYTFTSETQRIDDLEKIWFVSANIKTNTKNKDINLDATSNVLLREWIVHPKMTLYVVSDNIESLYDAFRTPRYTPVLGRSQDLVSYRSVDKVTLSASATGVFRPSLLPQFLRDIVPYGASVHMPRYIDSKNRSAVNWEWYIALERSVVIEQEGQLILPPDTTWIDQDTWDEDRQLADLLTFHTFVDHA